MIAFNSMLILLTAFLVVLLQSGSSTLPRLLGTQIDLLPALMVYAALTSGPVSSAAPKPIATAHPQTCPASRAPEPARRASATSAPRNPWTTRGCF